MYNMTDNINAAAAAIEANINLSGENGISAANQGHPHNQTLDASNSNCTINNNNPKTSAPYIQQHMAPADPIIPPSRKRTAEDTEFDIPRHEHNDLVEMVQSITSSLKVGGPAQYLAIF